MRSSLLLATTLIGTTASAQPVTHDPPAPVIAPSNLEAPTEQTPEAARRPHVFVVPGAPPAAPPDVHPPAVPSASMAEREDEVEHSIAVVWFAASSAELPAGHRDALARAARWQILHPERLLYVEGYDDHRASAQASLRLSQQRADAVRAQLVALGAACGRIVVVGYGDSEPLKTRAASRRVVVRGSESPYPGLVAAQDPSACSPHDGS